jgi:hypothetical protein
MTPGWPRATAARAGHEGGPTTDVVAVAVAAINAVLDRRVAAARVRTPRGVQTNPWRFSGRTWIAPVPLRRERSGP